MKRVTVILVTGRRIELSCDPTVVRVSHVLQVYIYLLMIFFFFFFRL